MPKRTSVKPKSPAPVDEVVAVDQPLVEGPVETPPVQPSTEVTTPPVDESEQPEGVKRQQISKIIGTSISPARVRRHLGAALNSYIDSHILPLKTQVHEYENAKKYLGLGHNGNPLVPLTQEEREKYKLAVDRLEPLYHDLKLRQHALSRERTRFSNETPIVLSIVCDLVVQQLVEHAMEKVLLAKKKIIQVGHLHEQGVENLPLYPLVKTLPSFRKIADELKDKRIDTLVNKAVRSALVKAERDFRKRAKLQQIKLNPEEVAPATEEEDEVEVDDDETAPAPAKDSKTSFKFYVYQVCNKLKSNPRFSSIRVSTDIKFYLSDILVELVQRLSHLIYLTTVCMKNKTVNDMAILRTVEKLLVDGHKPTEQLEFKNVKVPDPELLKQEDLKKEEAKRTGVEYEPGLVPLVDSYVVVKTLTYHNTGYNELLAYVNAKMDLYNEYVKNNEVDDETDDAEEGL
jgi:hypothetical protein